MKKTLIFALAAAGLALIPTSPASASAPVTVCQSGPVAMPAVVTNHYVVLVEGGRRYYRRRRWVWVNGHRRYVYTRIYL